MTQGKENREAAPKNAEASDPIMAQLKDMYDSVVDEPLPNDLLALLDKLDEAERSR